MSKVTKTAEKKVSVEELLDSYASLSFKDKAKTYKELHTQAAAIKKQMEFLSEALKSEFDLQPKIEEVDEVSKVVKILGEEGISQVMLTSATVFSEKKDKVEEALDYFSKNHLDEHGKAKFLETSLNMKAVRKAVDDKVLTKKTVKLYVNIEEQPRLKVS